MKTLLIIIFLLIASKLYNAPCPEEDYPNIKYGNLESITFCLSDIGWGECDDCCITVYFYKRWIAAHNYFDILIDYVSPHQTESCYLCYRMRDWHIIEKAHKEILKKYAFEYGLNDRRTNIHHLTLRAGCARPNPEPPYQYDLVCSIEENSCCHANYEVGIDEYGEVIFYRQLFGYNYYSNPPICTLPCFTKCGLVPNLNLFSSHPKIGDEINIKGKNETFNYNSIVTHSNETTIYFGNNYTGKVELDIFNELGSKRTSAMFYKNKGINEYNLSLENLETGIYFLRINMNKEYYFIKLLKLNY